MSYETKAGVAVSCSFLCLVGVVLTSKLWEGQAANAGTPPQGPASVEVAGPNPQLPAGAMAPEPTIPKLQPVIENGVQQVNGTGNGRPPGDVSDIFKDPDDPFQQEPLNNAAGPKGPAVSAANPSPEFNSQPVVPAPVANQMNPALAPSQPLATAGAGLTDPKKADATDFDAMANALRKQAADGKAIGNTVVGNTQHDLQGVGGAPVAVVPEIPKATQPTLAELAAKQEKKIQTGEINAQNSGPDSQKSPTATADDFAKELARQKSLEQGANASKDPNKDAAAAADAALAAGRQPFNNGAAALNDPARNGFNAATDPAKQLANAGDAALAGGRQSINNGAGVLTNTVNNGKDNAAGVANDALNAGKGALTATGGTNAAAGTGQPRWPANATDGYPGQTEAAAIGSGSRGNPPVSLGTPTSPPDNQFAQLRSGQSAPGNSGPPPIGTKPDVSVQPVGVVAPTRTPPAQQGNWDDDLYQARSGETFPSIARDHYQSERYGQALMYYNRDYPLATVATQRDPATIAAGQRIYLPPTRILQRDYGSIIPDPSAAPPASAAGQPAAPAAVVSTATIPLPEKRYRVPGGGAMFLTIARSKLGDENRWPEIYRLNPSFEPTNLVPGGTVLRMPGDAKIDPADVPAAQ